MTPWLHGRRKVSLLGIGGYHIGDRFTSDETVQMPINILDHHHLSFTREIIPLLTKRNIGIIAMKSAVSGNIVKQYCPH